MSLLSPDSLYLALTPDRVGLMRVARGLLRPRVLARESIAVETEQADERWRPALDLMARTLKLEQWRGTRAHVVLSNGFARYRLVPWSAEVRDPQEQHALVRHRFAQVHGDRTQAWSLRWSEGSASQPTVACGVDDGLIEGIRAATGSAGIRVISTQPYLVAAFNEWRKRQQEKTAWLVLAERKHICIALLENGTWKHIAVRALTDELDEALPVLLDQESFAAQVPGLVAPIYLHAPGWPGPRLWQPEWTVHELVPTKRPHSTRGGHAALVLSLLGDHDA